MTAQTTQTPYATGAMPDLMTAKDHSEMLQLTLHTDRKHRLIVTAVDRWGPPATEIDIENTQRILDVIEKIR